MYARIPLENLLGSLLICLCLLHARLYARSENPRWTPLWFFFTLPKSLRPQTLLSRYKKDTIALERVILLDEARRHLDYFLVTLRVERAARRQPDEPRIV